MPPETSTRHFLTEININASVEKAWHVLTEFDNYRSWNPSVKRIEGLPEIDSKLRLHILKSLDEDTSTVIPAKVRTVVPMTELSWGGGIPGAPFLLDIHHYFRLENLNENQIKLIHGENFRGILIAPFWPKLRKTLGPRYDAYNLAFKSRCESL